MIELIKWLHDLIRDKGTKWFAKLFLIISILFVVYLVDDYFGWSYYSQANNKVELLKNINESLKDSSLTVEEINFLKIEKFKLLNRKTIPNIFFDFSQSVMKNKIPKENLIQNFKNEFFNGKQVVPIYRLIIISIGPFALCLFQIIRFLRMQIVTKRKILAIFLTLITFILVNLFYTFLVSLIPVILVDNIWINYVICIFIGIINTYHVIDAMSKETFKQFIFD